MFVSYKTFNGKHFHNMVGVWLGSGGGLRKGRRVLGAGGGEIIIGYRNACLYSLVGMIIVHKFVYSKGFMVLYFWRLGQGRNYFSSD